MSEDARLEGGTELVEELAALEHRQWMHWSKAVAENNDIPDDLEAKWRENWMPYEELDDDLKEHDRKWARKVVEILESVGEVDS